MESRLEIRPGRTIALTTYPNQSSDSTIFLIHGLGGQGAQWREQIAALEKNYTLIVPDLLGHGDSDKPASSTKNRLYDFPELQKDLAALFSKYASQTNIIIGHSYGGALATTLAQHHQDQVSRLVLISPTPCLPSIDVPWIYRLPAWMMTLLRPYLERTFVKLAFTKNDPKELIEAELLLSKKNEMAVIEAMVHGMQTTPTLDVTTFTIPTLIILGEQDHLIPAKKSRQFYKLMPYHTFKTIPDTAHLSQLEKPERVNQEILSFIQPDYLNLSHSITDFCMSIK